MAFWFLRGQQFCLHRFHPHRWFPSHDIVDGMGIRLIWATYSYINHFSSSSFNGKNKDEYECDSSSLLVLPSIPLKAQSPHSIYTRKRKQYYNSFIINKDGSIVENRKMLSESDVLPFLFILNRPIFIGFRFLYLTALMIPLIPLLLIPGGLLRTIEMAGGTFIKLGQWASTRADLFGIELCRELGKLQENAALHDMYWNRRIILEDFGLELDELFSSFSVIPIGSGTIAQVHLAQLRDSSKWVCVKIRHPRVKEIFEADLAILAGLFRIIENISEGAKWLSLSKELSSFSNMMMNQLDLRLEGWALEKFHRNFVYPSSPSYVPLPIRNSRRVLIEEWMEESISLSHFISITTSGSGHSDCSPLLKSVSKDLSKRGLDAFLQMVLWDNFVHADLHPGNILVRFKLGDLLLRDPTKERLINALSLYGKKLETQLCIIDGGMWVQMSSVDWKNFNDLFFTIIIKGDGEEAARLIIERSPTYGDQTASVKDAPLFKKKIAALIKPFHSLGGTLDLKNIGPILLNVLKVVQEHHVHLESSFANLIMSMITIEGIGRQLDPEINLFPHLLKGSLQYLVRRIGGERK